MANHHPLSRLSERTTMRNPYEAGRRVNPEDVCTIDSLANGLAHERGQSRLGGETVVVVCLEDSGLEYQPVKRMDLDKSEDGAVCRIVIDDVAPTARTFKISAHGKPDETKPVDVVQEDTGNGFGLHIEIPGYGSPIYLELSDAGEPVLRVYAHDPEGDPSHTIVIPKI